MDSFCLHFTLIRFSFFFKTFPPQTHPKFKNQCHLHIHTCLANLFDMAWAITMDSSKDSRQKINKRFWKHLKYEKRMCSALMILLCMPTSLRSWFDLAEESYTFSLSSMAISTLTFLFYLPICYAFQAIVFNGLFHNLCAGTGKSSRRR